MTIINSSAKGVKVLKAIGLPPLRIFPGANDVGNVNIDDYIRHNEAGQAMTAKFFTTIGVKSLSEEDRKAAELSKKKNAYHDNHCNA